MGKISNFLINALRIVILIVLGILTVISTVFLTRLSGDSFSNKFFILEFIMIIAGGITIFSKIRHRYKILVLLLIALVLRLFWILSVNTLPMSDFGTMYESAKAFLAGDRNILKGYTYLARFPHLIPMTFYMMGIIKLFPLHNLFVMKLLNVFFGCISVYLIYKLSDKFIKSEKNKLFVLLLGAVFPPLVTYTSVLCTENLAIPLYLITMIMFYKAENTNSDSIKYFIISGCFLAFSNLFRGVAIVFLIAFSIYLFLCTEKRKFTNVGSLLLGYIIITVLISGVLLKLDIIERPLWSGAEPSSATLLLKGTNFNSNGMWNLEDAKFVDEHLKSGNLTKLCFEKVKERISSKTPKELVQFYAKKFDAQWKAGDCSGTYWAYMGADMKINSTLPVTFQIIYVITLIFSCIALIKNYNKSISLLNIILVGCGLLFIVIETQSRYSYIVCWIFVILGGIGIERLLDFIGKGKTYGWNFKKKVK